MTKMNRKKPSFGMPEYIEIEPTQGCNLRCRMCHVYYKKPTLDFLNLDKISDFSFLKGKTVNLGAAYEPLIHPEINKLIDILNNNDCEIAITTNGHFLDKKKIPALCDANIGHITFSFDGISKQTYENIRIGGSYSKALGNIEKFISSYSNDKSPVFVLNYTVLRNNLSEVEAAPKFWNDRGVDFINYIAMHTRYDDPFLHENSLWPIKEDYFNSLEKAAKVVVDQKLRILLSTPFFKTKEFEKKWGQNLHGCNFSGLCDWSREPKNYRVLYEYGADFGMKFPCKSAFSSARILPDANVMLCSINNVGNLYDNLFDEIWYGEKANSFRDKIVIGDSLCHKCDYYRLCIDGPELDLNNIENYYSQHMRKFALLHK